MRVSLKRWAFATLAASGLMLPASAVLADIPSSQSMPAAAPATQVGAMMGGFAGSVPGALAGGLSYQTVYRTVYEQVPVTVMQT